MARSVVSSTTDYEVDEIDEEEGRALVDTMARENLGMSGEEFVRRWNAGDIPDPDRTEVLVVAMLLPFMNQSQ
jgi:hypothetical protein